jgi:DNA-binding PadR family transcriptional regulator
MTQPDTDFSTPTPNPTTVGNKLQATRRIEHRSSATRRQDRKRMTIRSPVTWALLGLVIERPSYGYELCKRFERRYAQSLPISSDSHIYSSLDALETKALIERIPPTGKPSARQPRPCYRPTEHGLFGYCAWLEATARRQTLPSEVFICALAALVHRPHVALLVIDLYEKGYLQQTAEEANNKDLVEIHSQRQTCLAERLLSEGRRLATEVAPPWIRYARHEFEELLS